MIKQELIVEKHEYENYAHVYKVFVHIVNHLWKHLRTGTYGDTCEALGIDSDGHAIRHALGQIQKICDNHGWPRLNYLVVNQKTHRPGDYIQGHDDAWRAMTIGVYCFPWDRVELEPKD